MTVITPCHLKQRLDTRSRAATANSRKACGNQNPVIAIKRHHIGDSAKCDQIECVTEIRLFDAYGAEPTSVAKRCPHSAQHVKHDPHTGKRFAGEPTVRLIGVHDDVRRGQ